jgi:hypothetical protein
MFKKIFLTVAWTFVGLVAVIFYNMPSSSTPAAPAQVRYEGNTSTLIANNLCEAAAKKAAMNPQTVDYSRFISNATWADEAGGDVKVVTNFTASNKMNFKSEYTIRCIVSNGKLIYSDVNLAQ